MNRKQKIELLKALQSGKKRVADLIPKHFLLKVGYDGPSHFINGKEVSEQYFNEKRAEYIRELERNGEEIKIKVSYGPEKPIIETE